MNSWTISFPLEVQVRRRVFATESSVQQRAISEIFAGLEILPDHGLPAGNHAREQLRPVALLELFTSGLDCLAHEGGALPHLPQDHLAVETHLRRCGIRLRSGSCLPVQAPARARRPVPVQGLHVTGVAPQVLAPCPEHGIVDMETDGHISLERQTEGELDEPGDLGVTMVKGDRPQHDGQAGLLVADGADPPLDVLRCSREASPCPGTWGWRSALAHAGDSSDRDRR